MKKCISRHVVIQPKQDEYKCPKCRTPGFSRESDPDRCDDHLHSDDLLNCCKCGFSTSGAVFSECVSLIRKRDEREKKARLESEREEPCPCCKGTGKVTKDGLEDWLEKLRKQFKERFP